MSLFITLFYELDELYTLVSTPPVALLIHKKGAHFQGFKRLPVDVFSILSKAESIKIQNQNIL